jgi:hypothetical protein
MQADGAACRHYGRDEMMTRTEGSAAPEVSAMVNGCVAQQHAPFVPMDVSAPR